MFGKHRGDFHCSRAEVVPNFAVNCFNVTQYLANKTLEHGLVVEELQHLFTNEVCRQLEL